VSTANYSELSERIRHEIPELERAVERSLHAWYLTQRVSEEQGVYLDSVALNLHGFYAGLERLFELIARRVDRVLPEGKTWHRDLLLQMKMDKTDVRPAVVGEATAAQLDDFRRFRHLVRNVYTFNLIPDRMAPLLDVLPVLWHQLRKELLAFSEFLAAVADASPNN
jgi:hypothetical protein